MPSHIPQLPLPVQSAINAEYRLPRLRLGDFRASVRRTAALSENLGRDERIRTSDPHTPSVMRYQAALRPDRRSAFRRGLGKLQGIRCGLLAAADDSLIILPPPLHLW